jgi:hypothetical protein
MRTLLLDRTAWDLVLDASGNIASGTDPYQIAQDVATAVRTFQGECWYDTTKGIPYFQQILGQWPPLATVRAYVEKTALTVPGVAKAQCTFVTLSERALTGEIQITDAAGATQTVVF